MQNAVAQSAAEQGRTFNIRPQSLQNALTIFGRQAGVQISVDAAVVQGLASSGVTGSMTPQSAIGRLLAGTGLSYHFTNPTTVLISTSGAPTDGSFDPDGTTVLDRITIVGNGTNNWDTPPEYAGGQVATGGALGVLGNRDVMSTPFTVTNYTSKLIEHQNAQSVADVVKNDPAIRNVEPTNVGNGNYFIIRGVQVGNGALAYNGLFGVAPNSQTTLAGIERVEVIKGLVHFWADFRQVVLAV
ncbi:TonB-dependent receptor plug domain-containing protein [Ochrobactrum cytisi]|nr:TonB-dependent receptor plug domain-containing protein [Brucella cytisi]